MFCNSSNTLVAQPTRPVRVATDCGRTRHVEAMLNPEVAKQVLVPSDEMASASASTPSTQRAPGACQLKPIWPPAMKPGLRTLSPKTEAPNGSAKLLVATASPALAPR